MCIRSLDNDHFVVTKTFRLKTADYLFFSWLSFHEPQFHISTIPVIRHTRHTIVVFQWFAIRPFPVIAAGAVLLTNWCLWSGFSLASKPAAILCQRKDISIFYIILHWCNMSTPLSSKLIMFFPTQRLRVVFVLWMF